MILTYAAVSLSAVPITLSHISKQNSQQAEQSANASPKIDSSQGEPAATTASSERPGMNFFAALGYLALVGLVSPVLNLADPLQGLIGLVILFVGMRIAWANTAGTKVLITGPFNLSRAF